MKTDIKVPAVGESITSGVVASWLKKIGVEVEEVDVLFVRETDMSTL